MESGTECHKTRNIMCFGHTVQTEVAAAVGTQYSCVSVMLSETSSVTACVFMVVSLCRLWCVFFSSSTNKA